MKGCFVRGLFGDELTDGHDELVAHDLPLRTTDKFQPEPCVWFAWGRRNGDILRNAGFDPITICSDNAYLEAIPPRRQPANPDYYTNFGAQPFGYNAYRLKLEAIRDVLSFDDEEFGDAIWLDLDVSLTRPLPSDFWSVLRSGQPIQAPCVQYHCVQCPWRRTYRRTSIYCATSYFRGLDVVERCLHHADEHPLEYEQAAINRTIDELCGGEFPGPEKYREMGFEFPWTARRGGMIHDPREPVLRIDSKGWSPWKRRGPEAWKRHVEEILEARKTAGGARDEPSQV